MASLHSLAHLVADVLKKNGIAPDSDTVKARIQKIILSEAYISATNENICNQTESALKDNNIPYILLKGAFISTLYPERWMRTSCDIDILIHEKDIEPAVFVLTEKGFTTDNEKHFHDVHLRLGEGLLELHFSICEGQKNIDRILENAWDYSVKDKNNCKYQFTNEFFAFHIISHMAHHFTNGGCGIKPFMDLWILKRHNFYNEDDVRSLCDKCGLLKFYTTVCQLIDIWFNDKEHTDLTKAVESFVLNGGTRGTTSNMVAAGTARNKSRFKFILSMVFLKKSKMINYYPVLNKYPFLLPFMYIKRLFEKISRKNTLQTETMLNSIKNQNNEKINSIAYIFKEMQIDGM